jgi:2-polyprenyl-6-methoxyphenol hydroxylase-like FAD-dependent oxidoreductase
LFGHFRAARRLQGKKEGHISICWFEHGWFWFIPLADGTTSVGAVCWPYYLKSRAKPLKDFFYDTIALCPVLVERLKDAELVDDAVHATGNYSYIARHCSGERYLMLGDAFTFIDPMFSSGVYLAMHSAFDSVDVVAATLDRPREAAAARKRFEATMRVGPREYSWFIYRVTNPTIRDMFMHPVNPLRVKEALMSLLAGDLYGGTPIKPSLFAMKAIYYLISLKNFRRSFEGWRRHRVHIRDMGKLQGETVLK